MSEKITNAVAREERILGGEARLLQTFGYTGYSGFTGRRRRRRGRRIWVSVSVSVKIDRRRRRRFT